MYKTFTKTLNVILKNHDEHIIKTVLKCIE